MELITLMFFCIYWFELYWLFVTRDCVMCNRYLCWVCYWRYGVYLPNNNAPNRHVRTYVDYQMLVF